MLIYQVFLDCPQIRSDNCCALDEQSADHTRDCRTAEQRCQHARITSGYRERRESTEEEQSASNDDRVIQLRVCRHALETA